MKEYNKQLTVLEQLGLDYEKDVEAVALLQKEIETILGEVETMDVQIKLEEGKIKDNDIRIQELKFRHDHAR